jgi:hypothetical protein
VTVEERGDELDESIGLFEVSERSFVVPSM